MTRQEAIKIAQAARAAKAPTLEDRFWSKVNKGAASECWEWMACVRRLDEGYGAFWLNGRHQPSSKIAWILSFGEVADGLQVLHRCDNPRCCNPSHLFLGTNKDNNDDKVKKRRHAFGARNGVAKLTDQDAAEIKRLKPVGCYARRGLIAELAERFGVTHGTIGDVWRRRWTHLN